MGFFEDAPKDARASRRQGLRSVFATARFALLSYFQGRRGVALTERLEVCFLMLMMLSVVLEINANSLGFSTGCMFRLLVEGDRRLIYGQLIIMAFFVGLSALYTSAKTYAKGVISRILRRSLTQALNEKYFGQEAFYRISRTLDNPDQRITADVREFASLLIMATDKFLVSPVLIVYYSKLMYDSSGALSLVIIYFLFVASVMLQRLVMPRLIQYTVKLEALEGDLRYAHTIVRNESEPIYLSRVGHRFRRDAETSFERIYAQASAVLALQFVLNFIGNFFACMGGVSNYMIVFWTIDCSLYTAPQLSEFISQTSFKVMYLISKLSDFVQLATHLTDLSAHATRISEFVKLAEERSYVRNWAGETERSTAAPAIIFQAVDITSPDELCRIRNFDLRINRGEHVYVTGPNGSGKTSLVRVLTRLWQPTRGRVLVLGNVTVACAPQDTIVYSGTLLEQLGLTNDPTNDDEACRALMACNLGSLSLRTGGMRRSWSRPRWIEMLSPGELQRLVLARLLLENPTFAILDEATSAIDMPTERAIYEEFWRRGITTITIGHRMDAALLERIAIFVALDGRGGHVIRRQGEELVFDSRRRT